MIAALTGDAWIAVKDGDHRALGLYRRHYSARKRRTDAPREFVGPYEHMVLLTTGADALFIWKAERWRKDGEAGINCAVFRNESAARSSDLIIEADARAGCGVRDASRRPATVAP